MKFPAERSSEAIIIDLSVVLSYQDVFSLESTTVANGYLHILTCSLRGWIRVRLSRDLRIEEMVGNNLEGYVYRDYIYFTVDRLKPFRMNRKGEKQYLSESFARKQITVTSFGDRRFDIVTLYDRREEDTYIGMLDKTDGDTMYPIYELSMGGKYETSQHCLLIHNGVLKDTDGRCYAPLYSHHPRDIELIPLMDVDQSLVRQ